MWTLSLELKSGHEPFTPSSSYCCGNWDACVMSSFHLAPNIPASWPSRPAQSSPALSLGFFLLFTVYPVRKALKLEYERQQDTCCGSDHPFLYLLCVCVHVCMPDQRLISDVFPNDSSPYLFEARPLSLNPGFTSTARLAVQWVPGNLLAGCTPHLTFLWCQGFKLGSLHLQSKHLMDRAALPAPSLSLWLSSPQ